MTSIAVTLPALVNFSEGVVIQMPHFNIKDLALGPAIYAQTGVPVLLPMIPVLGLWQKCYLAIHKKLIIHY